MNYDSLLLTSGGTKGYGIIGSLRYLEYNNYLSKFKKIIGISVGSIIGLLLVLKYKVKDIFYILSNHKIEDIYLNEQIKKYNLINNFLQNYSLNNTEGIFKLLNYFINNKNIDFNITFKELYEFNKINLIFIAANLNKNKLQYFSYKLTPNIQVLLALKASISIPFIFAPVIINNEYFVDGGLLTNEMIKYTNKNTLIIQLNTGQIFNNCNINNIDDYIKRIISILFAQSVVKSKYNKFNNNSIILNFHENGIKFKIEKNEKRNNYFTGLIQAKKFIYRKLLLKKIFDALKELFLIK